MSMPSDDYQLLTPLTLGDDLVLKNRVVFGPLTRARADRVTREASELNELYYEQRAGAGLIITEATSVSEQAHGWYGTPACYTEDHVVAWKRVVDRVHARDGKIFLQMWHLGRQGHSSFNAKKETVAASAIGLSNEGLIKEVRVRDVNGEYQSFEVPRPLETEEIAGIVEDFGKASALAKKAGFDGVEIHAANGYLIDLFLQSCTNKRTDKYGGSFENRARFLLEVVDAVKTVWPSHRIGVRLNPNGAFAEMGSEDNYEMFTYAMTQLSKHNLAYLAVLDGPAFGFHTKDRLVTIFDAKTHYRGRVMGCNGYTKDIAEGAIRSGSADLIAFGRLFVSNPDLAERFQNDWPVEPFASPSVYWNGDLGAEGYVTFPAYTPSGTAP